MVPVFKGIARKAVLPLIALTAIGWLLVMIGFGIGTNLPNDDDDRIPRNVPEMYPYWVVCLSGPFTFAAAVAHAALWKPFSPFVGAATSFLSVVFLTGLGMILYLNGNSIRTINEGNKGVPHEFQLHIPTFWKPEFAGAILATLFWTPVTILWHFYDGFWVATAYQEIK